MQAAASCISVPHFLNVMLLFQVATVGLGVLGVVIIGRSIRIVSLVNCVFLPLIVDELD